MGRPRPGRPFSKSGGFQFEAALSRPRLAVPQGCGHTAQVVCCLELAAMADCTGLSNISLSLMTTLAYLPLALLVRPAQGLRRILLAGFAILCHPLVLSGLAVLIDTIRFISYSSPLEHSFNRHLSQDLSLLFSLSTLDPNHLGLAKCTRFLSGGSSC